MDERAIRVGRTYSNGDFGKHWSVRQVVASGGCTATDGARMEDCITYKVLVGANRRGRFSCSRAEFARWAKNEVVRNENSWVKVADGDKAV